MLLITQYISQANPKIMNNGVIMNGFDEEEVRWSSVREAEEQRQSSSKCVCSLAASLLVLGVDECVCAVYVGHSNSNAAVMGSMTH